MLDIDNLVKLVLILGSLSTTGISIATFLKTLQIKHATDGMKTELVAVTRSDSLQEGRAEGKATEKADQALRDTKNTRSAYVHK